MFIVMVFVAATTIATFLIQSTCGELLPPPDKMYLRAYSSNVTAPTGSSRAHSERQTAVAMVTVPAILAARSCLLHSWARRNEMFEKKVTASGFSTGESVYINWGGGMKEDLTGVDVCIPCFSVGSRGAHCI
jgi:malonyl CoA-acyl carrier protein transacylase